jgi:hypothetical protein
MDSQAFSELVDLACQQENLPAALTYLQHVDEPEIAEVATSLVGQFVLGEHEGEKRIYHVTVEPNDEGVETEYVEHIMNEADETIVFIAWFFESYFDMKRKEIYAAAGRTYKQPKRS